MALIKCSNCEKEISDKAKTCPQCGHPVILDTQFIEKTPVICEECSTEIPEGVDTCPNCGCPVSNGEIITNDEPQKVEVTSVNLPKIKNSTKKIFIIVSIVIVVALIAFFIGNSIHRQKLEEEAAQLKAEYETNIETAAFQMLLGAVEAEETGNLIKNVWYNAIYEERDTTTDKYTRPNGYFVSDFNDALSNLFADQDFSEKISTIETNQTSVADLMKELKNPPEELEEAYATLKELYDAYTALTNLATNPTGSLTTFSQNFNAADTEFSNCYDSMKLYIEN